MRIGIDVSQLSSQWDGIGAYVLNEIEYLLLEDSENEYFLYSNLPLLKELPLNSNFTLRVEGGQGHLIWLLTKLPKLIKNDKLDVFWEPDFIIPYRIKGTKIAVTVHDMSAYAYSEFSSTKSNITHKLFLKPTCRKVDLILANSNTTKNEIIRFMGIDDSKIATIYMGMAMPELKADTKDDVTVLEKYSIISQKYLLFVGTLSPRKNADVIINAYFEYRILGGRKKLVIAGNISSKSEHLREVVRTNSFGKDVIFTGYITNEEKAILYRNSAMVLYPSRLEGFGHPLLEAMQAKVPVITSNVSCMPEIAKDAAIYLNNIDDYKELAERIFDVEKMTSDEKEILISKGLSRWNYFEKQDYRELTLKEFLKL